MGGKEAAAACRWVAKGAAIFISRYERGLPKNLLSALAFAGLIAAQFLSVVLVNTQRCEDPSPGTRNRIARAPACGSLAHSARKAFSLALGCLCDLLDGLQRNQQRALFRRGK
jgi:hypothetical protein